ncbi:MAG: CsbD family protein [Gemmataceae bacterium]
MESGTKQKWRGRWQQLSGRAKSLWGQITDDDLTQVQGDYERLVGLINERTGESREEIERRLDEAE